jgi:hypothetical protein
MGAEGPCAAAAIAASPAGLAGLAKESNSRQRRALGKPVAVTYDCHRRRANGLADSPADSRLSARRRPLQAVGPYLYNTCTSWQGRLPCAAATRSVIAF